MRLRTGQGGGAGTRSECPLNTQLLYLDGRETAAGTFQRAVGTMGATEHMIQEISPKLLSQALKRFKLLHILRGL